MPSVSKLHKSALWCVKHGIALFPVRVREKKPITEHGFKDASTDQEQIAEWWRTNPEANIGIPMETPTQLLLLDLDYRGKSVVSSLDDLIELYGAVPDTCEVISGSGEGRHIYFRWSGGRVPKQIAAEIELKGDTGYAVAPPSIHPTGNTYTFDGRCR